MSVTPEIELTADGSHTLFVPELNEHYHSVNGAVQESTHIFINTGLHHCRKKDIHIFEVGFGTGLNALLTLIDIQNTQRTVHYTTIEAFPLPDSIIQNLNHAKKYSDDIQRLYHNLHKADWGKEVQIAPNFFLTKIKANFTQFNLTTINEPVDIIYFDAFAPDKQPDMWTQQIFDNLFNISHSQGILVTYCAKGIVRRMMQQAGFIVERLPGPPGKREMLRATKGKE